MLDIVWAHFNVPDVLFEGGWSREGGSIVGDGAELANLRKKIISKQIHTWSPNNVIGCVWAHCNVLKCCGKCGRSREGGSVIGDGAELAVVVVVGD